MLSGTNLRFKLQYSGTVYGVMVTEIRTPSLASMLDAAGMDFMIVDMEHGTFTFETMNDLIAACRGTRVSPIVRTPEVRREYFVKALDAGAQGILVPAIERAEQVRDCVNFARYAPLGTRGVSLRKAHTGFEQPSRVEYTQHANDNVMVIIQVETPGAVEEIDEIMQVDGLDMVFIGPADLTHALSPDTDEGAKDRLYAAIEKVTSSAQRHGMQLGIHASDPALVNRLSSPGVQLVSIATDVAIVIDGLRSRRALFGSNE